MGCGCATTRPKTGGRGPSDPKSLLSSNRQLYTLEKQKQLMKFFANCSKKTPVDISEVSAILSHDSHGISSTHSESEVEILNKGVNIMISLKLPIQNVVKATFSLLKELVSC